MNVFSNAFDDGTSVFLDRSKTLNVTVKVTGLDLFFESKKLNLRSYEYGLKLHAACIFLGVTELDIEKHGKLIKNLEVKVTMIRGPKIKYKLTCMFPEAIVKTQQEVETLLDQTWNKFRAPWYMGSEFYTEYPAGCFS